MITLDMKTIMVDNKQLWVFDMDETLTHSKTEISDKMFDALVRLSSRKNVVVMSGAEFLQMKYQLRGLTTLTYLSVSGNISNMFFPLTSEWLEYVHNEFTKAELNEISAHCEMICRHVGINTAAALGDFVQNRRAQVSLSLVGHNADLRRKKGFDPTKSKRLELLKQFPFESDTLTVSVGGTTCLDYTLKSGTKGKNMRRLVESLNLKKDQALYIGDALFPGGNDYSVVTEGVCETIQVNNLDETYDIIDKYLSA
jgi:HAD superfamily hydrolase (TIGR01484 family)